MAEAMKAQRLPTSKKLAELYRAGIKAEENARSYNGSFGELVTEAATRNHLHVPTWKIAFKIAKMKNESDRNRVLALLDVYVDLMRKEGIFPSEHVGDLMDEAERGGGQPPARDDDLEEEGGQGEGDGGSNVVPIAAAPAPAKPSRRGGGKKKGAAGAGIDGAQLAEHLGKTDPSYAETLRAANDEAEASIAPGKPKVH